MTHEYNDFTPRWSTDFWNGKIRRVDEIIRIMNFALDSAPPSSACETYIGHAIDMLKEFKEQEL